MADGQLVITYFFSFHGRYLTIIRQMQIMFAYLDSLLSDISSAVLDNSAP